MSELDAFPRFSSDSLCASCLAFSADLLLKNVRTLRFVVFVVVSFSMLRPAQVVALKITAAGDIAVPIIWAANAWAAWVAAQADAWNAQASTRARRSRVYGNCYQIV